MYGIHNACECICLYVVKIVYGASIFVFFVLFLKNRGTIWKLTPQCADILQSFLCYSRWGPSYYDFFMQRPRATQKSNALSLSLLPKLNERLVGLLGENKVIKSKKKEKKKKYCSSTCTKKGTRFKVSSPHSREQKQHQIWRLAGSNRVGIECDKIRTRVWYRGSRMNDSVIILK